MIVHFQIKRSDKNMVHGIYLSLGVVFLLLGIRLANKIDWRMPRRADKRRIVALVYVCGFSVLLLAGSIPYLIAVI